MAINDNSLTSQQPVTVDPNFFLPPGLINAGYTGDELPSSENGDDVEEVTIGEGAEVIILAEPDYMESDQTTVTLRAPNTVTVVSQTVKIAQDGSQVVELLLDIEDVPTATDYEVRYSRV